MDSVSNNGGQKACKCKKSKCLQLYCDCFASGLYCDETCACKGCFNTPDYEDTVEAARNQIESKNPNAFSSKIRYLVEPLISQNVEVEDQVKPVAGKHRNGCNCKKSMCQKGYCECYQAGVGCSKECRCLGCKNKFGKRPADYNIFNAPIHVTVENEFDNPHTLTPRTPYQHFGHENGPSTTGRYIASPGSAESDIMLGYFDMVNLDQQAYLDAFMDQFTPPDHTTHVNARNRSSVMGIPPMMDLPYSSSTPGGSYSSVGSWPGSLTGPVTPVTVFGGPEVMYYDERPNHSFISPGNK